MLTKHDIVIITILSDFIERRDDVQVMTEEEHKSFTNYLKQYPEFNFKGRGINIEPQAVIDVLNRYLSKLTI